MTVYFFSTSWSVFLFSPHPGVGFIFSPHPGSVGYVFTTFWECEIMFPPHPGVGVYFSSHPEGVCLFFVDILWVTVFRDILGVGVYFCHILRVCVYFVRHFLEDVNFSPHPASEGLFFLSTSWECVFIYIFDILAVRTYFSLDVVCGSYFCATSSVCV